MPNHLALFAQVETIGDAYMVVGGCPEVDPDHAELVARQAHQMIQGSGHVLVPNTQRPVQVSFIHRPV